MSTPGSMRSSRPGYSDHAVGLDGAGAAAPEVAAQDGAAAQARPGSGWRSGKGAKWAVRLGTLAVFFIAWQVYGSHVSQLLLVPPTSIATEFATMVSDGQLGHAVAESLEVLALGVALALLAGIPIGLVWARYQVVDWALQPFVSALFSTPLIAVVPLYVLWFGYGLTAKVAIVGSFAFFPILLNTYQGAVSVDPMHRDVAKVFKATEWQTWRHVVLPSCIPFIVAGINVSLGHALTGLIISEFYTNAAGLGGIVLNAGTTFQTAEMFVPIIVIMALGITLMSGTRWLKRRLAPWAERQ
jgi:NitT/TauT family transport system permease protein